MAKLTPEAKAAKIDKAKASTKATKEKRKNQTCLVRELKINTSKMNQSELERLRMLFVEAKWLRNAILSSELPISDFDIGKDVTSVKGLDKNGKVEDKPLHFLTPQMRQSVQKQLINDISALSAKKKKGYKVGKLTFVSEVNSIDLKQFKITYNIFKSEEKVRIQKFPRLLHVHGMHQLLDEYEFANAKLIKKPSGYYLKVTCYVDKKKDTKSGIPYGGIDLGIKTSVTTSDNDKRHISIKESDSLKKAQKRLSHKKKGSHNRYKARMIVRREYEKITNRRQDVANKIVNFLTTKYDIIFMQDENIKGWHKGLFGKQVQHSALGTVKQKLIGRKAILIDRWAPTTKECFICDTHSDIKLGEEMFSCNKCGYTEERDLKAAKTILKFGLSRKHLKTVLTGRKEQGES